MTKLGIAFNAVKNYFTLSVPFKAAADYNYWVLAKYPAAEKSIGKRIKDYFDLYEPFRLSQKVANEIGLLAKAEGIVPESLGMKLGGNGVLQLKCDEAFAKKAGALASVRSVTPMTPRVCTVPMPKA